MSVLHKVTAIEQLALDATYEALRDHFGDRNVRWVHWTLRGGYRHGLGTCAPPIVEVLHYDFRGMIEVPRQRATYIAYLDCAIRRYEDGSRQAFSVQTASPFYDMKGEPLHEPSEYMHYILGEKHPRGRSRDAVPKFLPRRLALPFGQERVES